jgi:hypothetical protein
MELQTPEENSLFEISAADVLGDREKPGAEKDTDT